MNNNTHDLRWPAEWEPHLATWMAFPCRVPIWSNGIESAMQAYAKVANQISEFEPLNMLVNKAHLDIAKKLLSSQINIVPASLDDSWARDTAPIWVKKGDTPIALDFAFNAWGNKFFPHDADKAIAQSIIEYTHSESQQFDMVLEGGSIHGNGKGLIITTEECLLNANRNPQLSRSEIEANLQQAFNTNKVIWLKRGVHGDVDTDGHIDNIACFVNEDTIVSQCCGPESENHSIYAENKQIIQQHGLQLVEIPEPQARYVDNMREPLSYINFYLANGAVIAPRFGCKQDDAAQQILADLFPQRQVCMIDANEILVGGGGIHCITMQQPL
ncbi:agmatine deiminase family protein [Aliikangiella sp. IMCC44632]